MIILPSVNSGPVASSLTADIIWKIAVFGAGTDSSNGEYVWDGVTLINGEPAYLSDVNTIYWDGSEWIIEDTILEEDSYQSADLITWEQVQGALPVPSSALSYSQSSFINSIYFGTNAEDDFYDAILSRSSGGTTLFSNGPSVTVGWNDTRWEAVINEDIYFYYTPNLFNWVDIGYNPQIALIIGMTYSV